MRNDLMKEESKAKEQYQKNKMDELNQKIAKLETIKKEKNEIEKKKEDDER